MNALLKMPWTAEVFNDEVLKVMGRPGARLVKDSLRDGEYTRDGVRALAMYREKLLWRKKENFYCWNNAEEKTKEEEERRGVILEVDWDIWKMEVLMKDREAWKPVGL